MIADNFVEALNVGRIQGKRSREAIGFKLFITYIVMTAAFTLLKLWIIPKISDLTKKNNGLCIVSTYCFFFRKQH